MENPHTELDIALMQIIAKATFDARLAIEELDRMARFYAVRDEALWHATQHHVHHFPRRRQSVCNCSNFAIHDAEARTIPALPEPFTTDNLPDEIQAKPTFHPWPATRFVIKTDPALEPDFLIDHDYADRHNLRNPDGTLATHLRWSIPTPR